MPMGRPARKPTDYELEILTFLWDRGTATVDDVHTEFSSRKEVAYTSVQSTLNAMVDKSLLLRVKEGRAFRYVPSVTRNQTTGGILRDLMGRLFDGSATSLVTHLLKAGEISSEELRDIQRRLEKDRSAAPVSDPVPITPVNTAEKSVDSRP
jgi:predicted transcriptional regulator